MDVKEAKLGDQLNRMAGISKEVPKAIDNTKMDKETFLKMFMQQLKYQDPLNPMKNEQFAQQMAMFSQVEQQINTNKNLEMLVNSSSNKQAEAFQLLGKEIVSHRAELSHTQDTVTNVNFKLPKEAQDLKIHIINQAGEKVRTIELGPKGEGDISAKWDGLADDSTFAQTGKYTFRVEATGVDGTKLAVADKVTGKVTGVTRKEGKTFLMVGDELVEYKELTEVKEPAKEEPKTIGGVPNPELVAAKDAKKIPQENATSDKKDSGTQNVSIKVNDDALKGLAKEENSSPPGTREQLSPMTYFNF